MDLPHTQTCGKIYFSSSRWCSTSLIEKEEKIEISEWRPVTSAAVSIGARRKNEISENFRGRREKPIQFSALVEVLCQSQGRRRTDSTRVRAAVYKPRALPTGMWREPKPIIGNTYRVKLLPPRASLLLSILIVKDVYMRPGAEYRFVRPPPPFPFSC